MSERKNNFQRNLFFIPIVRFLMVIGILTWSYIFPIYLRDLGASDMTIAFAYSLFALGFSVFQIIGGHIADYFRKKQSIIIFQAIFPILFIFMSMVKSYLVLILIYFIYSILISLQFPIITGLLTNSVSEKDLSKAFARYQAFFIMGFGIGPIIGYYLLHWGVHINNLFQVCAGFFIISFFIVLLGLEEQSKDIIVDIHGKYKKFKLSKAIIALIIIGIFFFSVLQLSLFGPLPSMFMNDILKLEPIKINYVFGIAGILGGIYHI